MARVQYANIWHTLKNDRSSHEIETKQKTDEHK